jgi:hypothetical protein
MKCEVGDIFVVIKRNSHEGDCHHGDIVVIIDDCLNAIDGPYVAAMNLRKDKVHHYNKHTELGAINV